MRLTLESDLCNKWWQFTTEYINIHKFPIQMNAQFAVWLSGNNNCSRRKSHQMNENESYSKFLCDKMQRKRQLMIKKNVWKITPEVVNRSRVCLWVLYYKRWKQHKQNKKKLVANIIKTSEILLNRATYAIFQSLLHFFVWAEYWRWAYIQASE